MNWFRKPQLEIKTGKKKSVKTKFKKDNFRIQMDKICFSFKMVDAGEKKASVVF